MPHSRGRLPVPRRGTRRGVLDRTALTFGAAGIALIVMLATTHRDAPRCPVGLVPIGARRCGEGQRLENGLCVGSPTRCSDGLELRPTGCVAPRRRVTIG